MALALRACLLFVLLLAASCHRTPIPDMSSRSAIPHASVYTVRQGDTLYSIGKRFGMDYHALARRNHIRYPYTIYVGQQLVLWGVAAPPRQLPGIHRPSSRTGSRHAVNRQKATLGGVRFIWPVKGKVSSGFGKRGSRTHDGIDIVAKEGTPVVAAADGVVVYADQRLRGYGKMVILRHAGNFFTAYAHNQRLLAYKGQKVKRGVIIARVGHTGRASGPHLHFEVRRGTTPVDPLAYLPKR